MTAIVYTALRELVSGHTASTSYAMDLRCTAGYPRRTTNVGADEQRSVNNSREVLLHFAQLQWEVQVLTRTAGELLQLREFLASTMGGEQFTFDEFGSVAVPGAGVPAARTALGWDERRIPSSGASISDEAALVTFTIERL
jgi:hypothetical protein